MTDILMAIGLCFCVLAILTIGILGVNSTIEIPRPNGCVEILTENNRVFGDDTIDRSLVCTKEIDNG